MASEEEANKRHQTYLASVHRTANSLMEVDPHLLASRQLWAPPSVYQASAPKDEQDLQLSYEESKWISAAIVWGNERPRGKLRQPHDNSAAILNHVYVKEPIRPSSWEINKISEGGFATIYATELLFWFVYSSEGNEYMAISKEDCRCEKSLVHRLVAVKREAEGCSRNQHELRILQMIKNGHPHFLPKYYIPVNEENPFPNCLLMDYLPFRNLGDFIHHNTTACLQTKLFLMFHTVQAVRHLREYSIVHLDLKPSNIMLFCNLLVKLIDFGESYHPEVKYTSTSCPTQTTTPASVSPTVPPRSSRTSSSPPTPTSSPWESSSTNCSTAVTPFSTVAAPPSSSSRCLSTSATAIWPLRRPRPTAMLSCCGSSTRLYRGASRRTPRNGPTWIGWQPSCGRALSSPTPEVSDSYSFQWDYTFIDIHMHRALAAMLLMTFCLSFKLPWVKPD